MPIKAELVEKTSKSGSKYVCIVIHITKNIEKIVFLTPSELELIKLTNNTN